MFKKFKVDIHIDHMLMHNCQMADPLNPYAKDLKRISSLRKKTEADHEKMARIEYEAGLYLNENREVIIPGRVFEAALLSGAKKSREGQVCLSSVIVENDAVITYDGGPLSVEELIDSPDHVSRVPVRVTTSKVMRTRPYFKNVKAQFVVALQSEIADIDQLVRWLEASLQLCGIGDWRPRYGRGEIEGIEEIKAKPVKRKLAVV